MTDVKLAQTTYNRSDCDVGIVHIGYGAFHRAHQAVYVDDFMELSGDLRWGIGVVNLRPTETHSFASASNADNGYVLKSIASDGTVDYRLVRSHVAFVDATTDVDAALDLFVRPSVKVASMTVTESGYSLNDDWSLDVRAAAVRYDLDKAAHTTIYGFLTKALAKRAAETGDPLTLMCCDNIRDNGHVLKNALLSFIVASGQSELEEWVRRNVTFPCSMVDRITPRSTDGLAHEIEALFPRSAASPIHAEKFSQWVLQNDFANDMPNLGQSGVEIVDHVEPYEEAKIRILNGGHTGLAYLGALAGYETFDQAMMDPDLRRHFDRFETDDVLAGLDDNIPFDTAEYLRQIAARFENKGIADQLERICMDGYSKMAIYIRPTMRACLQKGLVPNASFDCAASWVVYARRFKNGQIHVPYHEPFWDKLAPMLENGREQVLASDPQIWGDLPKRFDAFVPTLVTAIREMEEKWPA